MNMDGPHNQIAWVDVDGRAWQIELLAERIVVRGDADVIDLPAALWARDVYVSQHRDGFIVRIETFQSSVRFLVSREAAAPFFAHLGAPRKSLGIRDAATGETGAQALLLWPKVSPLAVWALICSVLAFIPVLGLLPAVVTVILLILHRVKVRRARAWDHSRALCVAAFIFLVVGLAVSALATWGLWQNLGTTHEDRLFAGRMPGGRSWGMIAGGIIVILLSLTVHEAAHAITAWWLGDGLARSMGRVTLNPLAHIDPVGTVLLPLILALAHAPVFGYARPVPVRVELIPRHRRAHILISIAGPGSNLVLAATSLMLLLLCGCLLRLAVPDANVANFASPEFQTPVSASGFPLAPAFGAVCTVLKLAFLINSFLAMFNLIPIPPLDGSWVLEHLFPRTLGRLCAMVRPYGFLVFLGALYAGLLNYLMLPVLFILLPGLLLLAGATGL
jgi:Zn-dependent protease